MPVMLFDYDIHCDKMVIRICMMFSSLQKLKNKQSSTRRLERFGPPLLLQMSADVVCRLQTFYL
ncbi:hypothetical protein HanRHA438_Chr04g0195781 [Helianthus annuus]|nr:hypothetical protein HanRHA438_Chr04g0195781 [Helianthus annuus]